MNVLSLFDGMSCGQLALHRAGVAYEKYFASEVDKYAIQVARKNFPDMIHIGDVTKVKTADLPKIDLLIGGSPCQGFSFAGKQLNFNDPRSALFFEFVRIKKELGDVKFLLENVVMKKEYQDVISGLLGVKPILINSALVSAQNRKRLYWTNIEEVTQPEDKGILLRDVLISSDTDPALLHNNGGFCKESRVYYLKGPTLTTPTGGGHIPYLALTDKALEYMDRQTSDGRTHWDFKHHHDSSNRKSQTITANLFKGVPYNVLRHEGLVRMLHPIECERLQTIPDNYTEGVSTTQRYKMIGNGWTVDVIAHIFKHLERCKE